MRDIFDEYCRDFERQRQEEASKQRPGAKKVVSSLGTSAVGGSDTSVPSSSGASGSGAGGASDQNQGQTDQERAAQEALLAKMQIVDRMVNQNTYADVAMDFKYWDDTSDALR
jgi:dynein intermediate chain 1